FFTTKDNVRRCCGGCGQREDKNRTCCKGSDLEMSGEFHGDYSNWRRSQSQEHSDYIRSSQPVAAVVLSRCSLWRMERMDERHGRLSGEGVRSNASGSCWDAKRMTAAIARPPKSHCRKSGKRGDSSTRGARGSPPRLIADDPIHG